MSQAPPRLPDAELSDTGKRLRSRTRWSYGGFWLGIVIAYAYTASLVAYRGFELLPDVLLLNLIWFPCICAFISARFSRIFHPGPWQLPQIGTRTLIVLVAYTALLLGSYIASKKQGDAARRYQLKWAGFDIMAKTARSKGFLKLAEYNEALVAKYERARWRPWLPVTPDPPLPDWQGAKP